jgi:hypothetical protein
LRAWGETEIKEEKTISTHHIELFSIIITISMTSNGMERKEIFWARAEHQENVILILSRPRVNVSGEANKNKWKKTFYDYDERRISFSLSPSSFEEPR